MWEILLCDLSIMEGCEMRVFWMGILRKIFRPYRRDIMVVDIPPS